MVVHLYNAFGGLRPTDNNMVLERDTITGQPTKIRQYVKRHHKKTDQDVWISFVRKLDTELVRSYQTKSVNKRKRKYVPRDFRRCTLEQRRAPNFQKRKEVILLKNVLLQLIHQVPLI